MGWSDGRRFMATLVELLRRGGATALTSLLVLVPAAAATVAAAIGLCVLLSGRARSYNADVLEGLAVFACLGGGASLTVALVMSGPLVAFGAAMRQEEPTLGDVLKLGLRAVPRLALFEACTVVVAAGATACTAAALNAGLLPAFVCAGIGVLPFAFVHVTTVVLGRAFAVATPRPALGRLAELRRGRFALLLLADVLPLGVLAAAAPISWASGIRQSIVEAVPSVRAALTVAPILVALPLAAVVAAAASVAALAVATSQTVDEERARGDTPPP